MENRKRNLDEKQQGRCGRTKLYTSNGEGRIKRCEWRGAIKGRVRRELGLKRQQQKMNGRARTCMGHVCAQLWGSGQKETGWARSCPWVCLPHWKFHKNDENPKIYDTIVQGGWKMCCYPWHAYARLVFVLEYFRKLKPEKFSGTNRGVFRPCEAWKFPGQWFFTP